ncbi:U6 snRNA-associated Sm-like protein LSm8 [Spathaspora sp. JA1]|nr:U6 snRNA-associated Sm-like protein LSm8 [Spathaspora sp. JA1]
MSDLKDFLNKKVHVITSDARFFEGVLQGYDKTTNIILENCIERILSSEEEDEENQEIPLGLYIIRGGEVVCVGEIDPTIYSTIDWQTLKSSPLKTTKNPL